MSAIPHEKAHRSRPRWIVAVLASIALGLASRRFADLLPAVLGKYPGDALWALMVFFCWGAVLPRAVTRHVALLAAATCLAIECLKLWSSPWWQAVRASTLGHLVFGHVFSWQNLAAYAVGIALGIVLEQAMRPALDRRKGAICRKPSPHASREA